MGKYAAGELKPPSTASSRGSGKHPQLVPSTPRWAVANGAGVILSVCDDEVARNETATLTAAAVPALLLPPPTTALDEHLVAGLPALEPYARLFHRYYAIATPSATQRLLLGLLEAPPSWAPDALDAAVQLVELLRAAEDYASGIRHSWGQTQLLGLLGLENSEVQEIPSFHKLQYAFMSMEGAATHWFYIWSQNNPDSNWESFSTALIKRFRDHHGNHIFERLSILKQEKPTETKTHIKKWETSTEFLEGRINISERKHMLCKILNEEVDSHASQQDKNSMEGSGSEFSEAKASSWARKFLKSENRSKEGSVIKNHTLCGGEETKNDEAKLAREKKIEKVMEEEVDPSIKREKHKKSGVTNVGCKDDFLDNPITDLIKKEVEAGDSTKPHCFQDSDFHKKIVMVKQKSFMKVVGTTMVLESWNVNLLGEPLALNFVASMADSLAMELRQKECNEPVKLIKVIWSRPLSLPPLKLLDLSLHAGLPRNWMHLHFLRAIGTAMSMRAGIAADAAAALLFRILSQPALLFPPLRQVDGVEVQHEPLGGYISSYKKQIEVPAAEASIEATAQGIASMLCAHGPEVEWRICTIWEAAYGLIPTSSSAVDLPEIIVATPLQPPVLSWNLYIPLLKVLEYLPRGSPSEACLMKIFAATVEAILQRTFPPESTREQNRKSKYLAGIGFGSASKNLAVAELRTMVHSLFLESCASVELASRLLFVVLTVCVSHEAQFSGSKRPRGEDNYSSEDIIEDLQTSENQKESKNRKLKKQGPVAAFDSYVLAAVCALACELQLFPLISRGNNHLASNKVQDIAKPVRLNGSSHELRNGLDSAVRHTHRILAILEALFSLKPSSVGTPWSYSSNEIVAAAMVAAHVSELFRRSKACMHALSVLIRCKWDNEIHSRASSLYNLIDIHSKAVASIVNKAEPLEATLIHAPIRKDSLVCVGVKRQNQCESSSCFDAGRTSVVPSEDSFPSKLDHNSNKTPCPKGASDYTLGKGVTGFSLDASDLANFLTMDRHIGLNCNGQIFLRSTLAEKQELCFSVVSLLWHKLIASPETQPCAESTSAQQGWRQVVDALCNVVSASPTKAATAVVLQAERELQPWIAKDDDSGQKMWRINQRIVKLIVELMRNHETAESLVIVASSSDLLLRATDGMLVDGEACTLPQLELLEATARAVQPVLEFGESGLAVADGLSNLLKCRLSATIRCLSHPSAHVRALSISVLRDILHTGSIRCSPKPRRLNGTHNPSYQYFNLDAVDWQADIEKCLTWEAHSRLSNGLSINFLDIAAKELGCTISM
ncbi:Protein GIGANTEA [Glycine soja]